MRVRHHWLGFLLVVLGVVRATVLVAHDPLIGYANQFDMHRTGACLGLYPDLPGEARYGATRDAPLSAYRFENPREGCYPSTEVALTRATAAFVQAFQDPKGEFRLKFHLRWLGNAKLLLLSITGLFLAWVLRRHTTASLVHGAAFFFVLADPTVTLWLNTMYTEFSVAWGIYAAIGALCALALSVGRCIMLWQLLLLALAALAFSKEQYAWLPVAFVLVGLPWLWRVSKLGAILVSLGAVAAGIVSTNLVVRHPTIQMANRANTYLGLVIPAIGNPIQALATLGLPVRCAPLIGANWYLTRGENIDETCPEVFTLSNLSFLKLAASEPAALARSVARVFPLTPESIPSYLGTLEGGTMVAAHALPLWARPALDAVTSRLGLPILLGLLGAAILAAPLALLVLLIRPRLARNAHGVALLFAMLLGGTVLHALLSTVFGDGLVEAGRHFWAGQQAILIGAIAVAIALARQLAYGREHPQIRQRAPALAATVLAIVVVVFGVHGTLRWAHTQPLAIGVLDQPADKRMPANGLILRGWALDPSGVESVQVVLGETFLVAEYGKSPSHDLHTLFPRYPDAERGRFELPLTAQQLAHEAQPDRTIALKVLVRSRTGTLTEIDRRSLRLSD